MGSIDFPEGVFGPESDQNGAEIAVLENIFWNFGKIFTWLARILLLGLYEAAQRSCADCKKPLISYAYEPPRNPQPPLLSIDKCAIKAKL